MNSKFAPHVQVFIDKLRQDYKVGTGAEMIEVVKPKSGSPKCSNSDLCDIFFLLIPYGGEKLQWEVMFFQNHPEFPPDFIFDDRQFMPNIQEIHSLCDWNPCEPESFVSVIRDLLDAYRKECASRLEANSRLHFEYTSLLQHKQMLEEDIQVILNRKNRNGSVSFHIKLAVDFSKIPPIFTEESTANDVAFLSVTFQNLDGGKVTPKLILSSVIERILGGGYFLNNFPVFPAGGCLMDYVPSVENFLTEKVEQLVMSFEKRKEYVSSLLDLFEKNVLEYDAEKYSKLSFLFEWNDFFFIVHITIPQAFPQERPKLQFQSIYSCIHGQPFKFNSSNYVYSPRWSGIQLAEKTRTVILECVSEFQKSSLKDM